MNIQQAKEIKLTDYLSALGHQPKRFSKSTSYYLSPLHAETNHHLVQGHHPQCAGEYSSACIL